MASTQTCQVHNLVFYSRYTEKTNICICIHADIWLGKLQASTSINKNHQPQNLFFIPLKSFIFFVLSFYFLLQIDFPSWVTGYFFFLILYLPQLIVCMHICVIPMQVHLSRRLFIYHLDMTMLRRTPSIADNT